MNERRRRKRREERSGHSRSRWSRKPEPTTLTRKDSAVDEELKRRLRPELTDVVGPLVASSSLMPPCLLVYLAGDVVHRARPTHVTDEELVAACRELHRRYPKHVFMTCSWTATFETWPRTCRFLDSIVALCDLTVGITERALDARKRRASARPPG